MKKILVVALLFSVVLMMACKSQKRSTPNYSKHIESNK